MDLIITPTEISRITNIYDIEKIIKKVTNVNPIMTNNFVKHYQSLNHYGCISNMAQTLKKLDARGKCGINQKAIDKLSLEELNARNNST